MLELIGYSANWGTHSNRQSSGGGMGNIKSTMNLRIWGTSEKTRGQDDGQAMMFAGNGGAGYHGGSSNFATESPELGVRCLTVANFKGNRGGENRHGAGLETGFAWFTQS